MPELTAYHECGHAVMALLMGAKVGQMTIEPDWDDGPARTGDAEVNWRHARLPQKEVARRMIRVCVAGPLAELIYNDEPFDPAWFLQNADEWSSDFDLAWELSEMLQAERAKRLALIMQLAETVYHELNSPRVWTAVQNLADHLLAHETLESEEIEEIVSQWLG